MKIAAVILAAGSSSRMSQSKQLLTYKGNSLIKNIAAQLSQTDAHSLICITGHLEQKLKKELTDYNCTFLHNSDHQKGMSSSLKVAVNHIMNKDYDGILVALTDQPLISTSHYQEIINAASNNSHTIITTNYDSTYGAPSLFKRTLFSDILKLNSHQGAKSIIKRHSDQTLFIDCAEAKYDIDTDDDYDKLIEKE